MYCKYVNVETRRTSMSKNTHVNKTKGDGSNRVQNRKQGDIEPCIEPLHFPAESSSDDAMSEHEQERLRSIVTSVV